MAVNLLVDAFGQRLGGVLMSRAQRAALARGWTALRAAGGVVTIYRPPCRAQRVLGGGQHVKIQVSEAGEAIFGSSNITKSSFEGWNEYAVAVRGPVARVLLESCRELGGVVSRRRTWPLGAAADGARRDLALDYWLCNPNARQGWCGPLGWRGPTR